jgi:DMSO/TMAO reductase YedYZ molybdopterin-dependent catalytic subunit
MKEWRFAYAPAGLALILMKAWSCVPLTALLEAVKLGPQDTLVNVSGS